VKRLVCVGEGHGEVKALPRLCLSIRNYLNVVDWNIDPTIVRLPRADFVAPPVSKRRTTTCNAEALGKGIQLARMRPADAVLVVCDADDDCAVTWGKSVSAMTHYGVQVAAVMAVREYEAWLLWNMDDAKLKESGVTDPEKKRDAKGAMKLVVPGYAPTTHQLELTRKVDVERVRSRSRSFDKLVRSLAALFGVTPPARRWAQPIVQRRPRKNRR